MIALIDGDMAIYMAAAAAQITIDLDDGRGAEPIVDEKQAAKGAVRMIESWTKKAGCSSAIVCLSTGVTFRKRLLPSYKANRTAPKPAAYAYALEAVRDEFEIYEELHLEADDLMGIAATSGAAQCVAVSRDKDMRTIPGLVFNPDTDRKVVKIRPAIADQMWMKQTIVGDTADNYPGIRGVGEVGAQEILLSPHRLLSTTTTISKGKNKGQQKTVWSKGDRTSIWQSMLDYAAKAGMTERELITMAQVSRILRTGDFDRKRRIVNLWTPHGTEEFKLDEE